MISFKSIFISCVFISMSCFIFAQLYVDPEGNVGLGVEDSPKNRMTILNNTENTGLLLDNDNAEDTTEDLFGIKIRTTNEGTGLVNGIQSIVNANNNINDENAIGLFSWVIGDAPGMKYGIYSIVSVGDGYAGYFEGDVMITGDLFYSNGFQSNEETARITNAISIVKQLEPRYGAAEYGFITDQVKQSAPALVKSFRQPVAQEINTSRSSKQSQTNSIGTKEAIDYDALIPVLTQAIKDQQLQIEKLQEELKLVKSRLEN